MSEGMKNSVVLMGCKHCGKSTQGKLLAKKLGVDFFDTDDVITRMCGMDARTLYKTNKNIKPARTLKNVLQYGGKAVTIFFVAKKAVPQQSAKQNAKK